MPIKTFRGSLTRGDQVKIRLGTIRGEIGYRIKKFQLMPKDCASGANEALGLLWRVEQATVTAGSPVCDFSNSQLLAAVMFLRDQGTVAITSVPPVIIDNVVINQDIYFTYQDGQSGSPNVSYYIELEQLKLSLDQAAVATLKDMRGS